MTKGIEWTPDKIDRLKELYLGNGSISYKAIAEQMTKEFGAAFSRCCISGKLSRMRMPLRGPRERTLPPTIKPSRKVNIWSRPARVPLARGRRREDGVQLVDLEYGDCKWPSGTAVPYAFCGKPVDDGNVYCQEHAKIAYNRSQQRGV